MNTQNEQSEESAILKKANDWTISEFMGISYKHKGQYMTKGIHAKIPDYMDWSELMPVVEKIESLGYEVAIEKHGCLIMPEDSIVAFKGIGVNDYNKLLATYTAVLSFIKYYNDGK